MLPTDLMEFIGTKLWPGLVVWALVYCSDYYLTILCARMYRQGICDKISFEGSYEITPYYQSDVDALRKFSPRFIKALGWTLAGLSLVWWLSMQVRFPDLYLFALGAFTLVEVPTHVRHLKNFFFFRDLLRTGGIHGRIQYPRPVTLRMSSTEFLIWAALFGVLFLIMREPFVLGGIVECIIIAAKHRKLAAAHVAKASAAVHA